MSTGRIQGDLLDRTLEFALSVLSLSDHIPAGDKGWTLGKQFIRSGTSVGANVREADHALTNAEFAHRCSIARKEASETEYWLTLLIRSRLVAAELAQPVLDESRELLRILSTIVRKLQVAR